MKTAQIKSKSKNRSITIKFNESFGQIWVENDNNPEPQSTHIVMSKNYQNYDIFHVENQDITINLVGYGSITAKELIASGLLKK